MATEPDQRDAGTSYMPQDAQQTEAAIASPESSTASEGRYCKTSHALCSLTLAWRDLLYKRRLNACTSSGQASCLVSAMLAGIHPANTRPTTRCQTRLASWFLPLSYPSGKEVLFTGMLGSSAGAWTHLLAPLVSPCNKPSQEAKPPLLVMVCW